MSQVYFPSVKRIEETFKVNTISAKQARSIMDGSLVIPISRHSWKMDIARDLEAMGFPEVSKWVNSCCNLPRIHEIRMAMLNECLDAYGVEFINLTPDNYNSPTGIEYLNMGDTYKNTICYFDGKYRIAAWGDILETWERKHGTVE